ncbi:hypothetical protein AND_003286 [Anopheles darlingi]|uniref:Uncharacterized protein n=1 Tax=Anopheles darlingi TaxID=43151 RepID=W5JLH3_ANODA|nr:hypothetical protein AND_003286 [Anopheles darlingi]
MFKYVVVLLALVAAVFAAPKPQLLYAAPAASYSYSESYRAPPAPATVYTTGLLPGAYPATYSAPALYSAGYPAPAYLL